MFQIISNEIPISLLSHVNDFLIFCSVLCNFKEPLFNDLLYSIKKTFVKRAGYLCYKAIFCHKVAHNF